MNLDDIRRRIFTIRDQQVMLDKDLSELYEVETRVLKQAVNRNMSRFPQDFMFILTKMEVDAMVSQSVIPSKMHLGGALPYVFTEQGVANLAGVLSSKRAVEINIHIMRAFVAMRKFIFNNTELFVRLDSVERKQTEYQLETHQNFERVFKALEDGSFQKKQGIFFDGQIFDAYTFASELIRGAKKSIILIDNYVDDSVLLILSKRRQDVHATIYTKEITMQLSLDLAKHNAQYPPIEVKEFKKSHDRFLIIDNKEMYHIGASLKDLGKKWFAFSKFDKDAFKILERLNC